MDVFYLDLLVIYYFLRKELDLVFLFINCLINIIKICYLSSI